MTEKSVPLSQVGVNTGQCAARTELFSITHTVTLDGFNLRKLVIQLTGRLIHPIQDLLYTPSELISNLGPAG